MEMNKLLDEYGRYTFNDETMKERIPKSTYKAFHEALDKGEPLSKEVATVIANAMKIWAVENGATHFTHWFMPMTGLTAEKHDAFLKTEAYIFLHYSVLILVKHLIKRLHYYVLVML